MANVQTYLDLITSEHQSAPNFMATVSALAQAFVDLQNVLLAIPEDYDLDTAVGSQLDVDGQWIGLSRILRAPVVGVYFSFGIAGQGFSEGVWKSTNDPTYGLVTLDDDTYRMLLIAKARANTCDGSLAVIQEILQDMFAQFSGTLVFVQDRDDMTFTIGIS